MCGADDPVAETDVCLILLVLVNGNPLTEAGNAEAQAIAGAIAAFQLNTRTRRDYGLDPLDTMTIPCVTMTNTRPDFYLIPVTTVLSDAVMAGRHPTTQTQVLRCPIVDTRRRVLGIRMDDREYRKLAFKSFLAFKTLAKSHWVHILKGIK